MRGTHSRKFIMAKPTPKPTAKPVSTEVAEVKQTGALVAAHEDTVDDSFFAADSGAGMEGTTAESFAIPFLSVLQKGSPQVDETVNGGADLIDGAKAGMLFDSVSREVWPGKEGVLFVPCSYRRVFLHWGPRAGEGAGFKGELNEAKVAELRAAGKVVEVDGKLVFPNPQTGEIDPKKCDRIADTRNHYGLIVDEGTGAARHALLSLTSTQIKKSKGLMALLAAQRVPGPNGPVNPPTFANLVRITTTPEQNDHGSWYGVKFDMAGRVGRSLYEQAKAFHAMVQKGTVAVKYEDEVPPATSADGPASF
jgi:hypothetical protein